MLLVCILLFVALLLATMLIVFGVPQDYDKGWAGHRCPENTSCTGGSLMAGADDTQSIHDYVFNASAGDKIWRGFVLGCAVGLFVAALFCCWAPCFRFGARGAVVRAWRYPRRIMADAEEGARHVGGGRSGALDEEAAGGPRAEHDRRNGRFVNRAALAAVAY